MYCFKRLEYFRLSTSINLQLLLSKPKRKFHSLISNCDFAKNFLSNSVHLDFLMIFSSVLFDVPYMFHYVPLGAKYSNITNKQTILLNNYPNELFSIHHISIHQFFDRIKCWSNIWHTFQNVTQIRTDGIVAKSQKPGNVLRKAKFDSANAFATNWVFWSRFFKQWARKKLIWSIGNSTCLPSWKLNFDLSFHLSFAVVYYLCS